MRTATVRDLRNHYTSLLGWIEAGEEIIITQKGRVVARLVPEKEEESKQVDWSKSPAVLRDRSEVFPLSAEESRKLIHESSGQW